MADDNYIKYSIIHFRYLLTIKKLTPLYMCHSQYFNKVYPFKTLKNLSHLEY